VCVCMRARFGDLKSKIKVVDISNNCSCLL